MKRFTKLALIPAAVTAVLAGNAYAGTEACFEIYKTGDNAGVSAFDKKYTGAACAGDRVEEFTVTNPATSTLLQLNEIKIAYELTGNLPIDFDDITGGDIQVDEAGDDQHIVYIPTTDIPGGTKLKFKLTGAVFDGNANQIHLVKHTDEDGAARIEAVASSDGEVDGESEITFITKAGITIGAGTRLAFSRISTGEDNEFEGDAIEPVGILIANDACTTADISSSVSLKALEAITDGGNGYSILGAISQNTKIADISAQFYAFQDGLTAEGDVNAESTNSINEAITARTEFVFDPDASNQLVSRKSQVIFKSAFYDRATILDRKIDLSLDDKLETKFVTSVDPGNTVRMGLYNSRLASTGVLDEQEPAEASTLWGDYGLTEASAPMYETYALDVFTPNEVNGDAETNPVPTSSKLYGAEYNQMFYAVTNTNTTDGVMNFNYTVDTNYTLDFGDEDYIDHCNLNVRSHEIGVNGAVLKVPYAVNGEGNFVRVTNEHDEAAEVTVDVFGESDDGTTNNRKVTAVRLGTVAAQSSVVYFVPDLIEEAVDQAGYTGADGGYAAGDLGSNANSNSNRHTLTFTVTAPRDTVHGVSVQRTLGGSDRVMPVLDRNEWSQ
ncbi:hypothetical protein OIZ54_08135 [Pseudoalteromonas sp. A3]|uniref:hypothetical protein n=1 Tax=Pseudoalteromonas sp. A3 TaxID=142792 RepID=UPI00221F1DFD|nr:hypothetical protein [Pseudoalteromonas sp. A3]MCW1718721.1 hypothetical protein [Pseudoalteromonas sp. A3]